MQREWTPRWRTIFAIATGLGVFSSFQAYRLTYLTSGRAVSFVPLLWLNIVYWYVPALLTPSIFRLAHRFRFERPWRVGSLLVRCLARMAST